MSKYTTEVRFICETEAGLSESAGFNNIEDIITEAAPKIFNFNFPIYDEAYRLIFEKNILRHFYVREIGLETVGLWKLKLQDKLMLIMPYYNKLYKSELLEFNPFYDVDVTKTHEGESNGTEASVETDGNTRTLNTQTKDDVDTDRSNTHWDLYSDTPQGGINGITADNDSVANNTYLTDARKITDNGSETVDGTRRETGTITDNGNRNRNATASNLTEYTERVVGKQGGVSYAKLLEEFRKTFLQIDARIMEELEPLFMQIW